MSDDFVYAAERERLFVFFFSSRRRHTIFDCDWSSDVCSSDLYKWTEEGKLVETEDTEDQDRFVQYLNQAPTETFKTEDAVAYYKKKFKVERDTVQKEIKRALDSKWIERLTDDSGKVKKGHYRKVEVDW